MRVLVFLALWRLACFPSSAQDSPWGSYNEPDFPFVSTMVDGRDLGPEFPNNNLTPRGVVFNLGNEAYMCFDTDLLRMAVGWTGEWLSMDSIPMTSYHTPHRKVPGGQEKLPKPLGQPIFATGIYPGVFAGEEATFADPRTPGPDAEEVGRGRVDNLRVRRIMGETAGLTYEVGQVSVAEQCLSHRTRNLVALERRLLSLHGGAATWVLGECGKVERSNLADGLLILEETGGQQMSCFAVLARDGQARLRLENGRHVVCSVQHAEPDSPVRFLLWRGKTQDLAEFQEFLAEQRGQKNFQPKPRPPLWPETITTVGKLGNEDGPFVLDEIALPLANPWKRNVRPSALDFLPDGRLVICTIDGDVWVAENLTADLAEVRWHRVGAGLHEPQGLAVRDDRVFVFTRNGLVEVSGAAEKGGTRAAVSYSFLAANFSQTAETREYPMDMVLAKDGGFYIAKGGQQETRPGRHNGRILKVSPDGQEVTEIASGLRQPYLGYHPTEGILTNTDQQGHFVPATPIRVVKPGDYFGFRPSGASPEPPLAPPLCWIPHPINQSAAGQVWALSQQMGELNGRLIHLAYHRPAIFTVLFDWAANPPQGGVVPLTLNLDIPLLKGRMNPKDGYLYLTGFQIWGTSATKLATLVRLRPGKRPMHLPTEAITAQEGVLLTFPHPVNAETVKPANFIVQRWNYVRRPEYGSGHFKLDGTPGQERLPIQAAVCSEDGKSIFLAIADMKPVMQFTVDYDLQAATGEPISNAAYLTIHALRSLDLAKHGFGKIDLKATVAQPAPLAAEPKPTWEKGQRLAETLGCIGCHSANGNMEGMKGPTWKGLFASERELTSGEKVKADAAYLREAILEPTKKMLKGYEKGDVGMPPYLGILDDSQLQSLLLYIQSLASP